MAAHSVPSRWAGVGFSLSTFGGSARLFVPAPTSLLHASGLTWKGPLRWHAEDWVRHRSTGRFAKNVSTMFT